MVELLMQCFIIMMQYWYIDLVILFTVIGWLNLYCLCIGKFPISAIMLPNFRQKYVMYMDIVHLVMFESKVWSMCIGAYGMFMYDYVQEWKRKIIRTCKGTYRASTSQWDRAVLSKTWASPWPDLRGIGRWESRGKWTQQSCIGTNSVLKGRLSPKGERGHSPLRDQVQKSKMQLKERDKKVRCTCISQESALAYAYLNISLCYKYYYDYIWNVILLLLLCLLWICQVSVKT